MTMETRRGNPFGGAHKVATTLLPGALAFASCYSAMPINNAKALKDSKSAAKTVIAYYDPAIGTNAIEAFIKKNNTEVLYRYGNINGYALKLKSDKQRTALEKTKGVLFVQNDQVMQLQ